MATDITSQRGAVHDRGFPDADRIRALVEVKRDTRANEAMQVYTAIARRCTGERLIGAEVGVGSGWASAAILATMPRVVMHYMVDPWVRWPDSTNYVRSGDPWAAYDQATYDKARVQAIANTEHAAHRRMILEMVSDKAARYVPDGVLSFCIIDGNHCYKAVRLDINSWWPKVKPGGVLMGSCFDHPAEADGSYGVTDAVESFAAEEGCEYELHPAMVWSVWKPAEPLEWGA